MKQLTTEMLINAPAEKVWEVLADFQKYPEWNPLIKSFEGEIREGERFKVTIQPPGAKPMTFKPTCLKFTENRELRWKGHLFFRGLFDGEHIFELSPAGAGKTKFVQRENFEGILVPVMWKSLEPKTKNGFEMMNVKLKEMAESLQKSQTG
jgi:hypothetical protein